MSDTTRVFCTIYVVCCLAWLAVLPCTMFGMGPGKPNHDLWRRRTDPVITTVLMIAIATAAIHILVEIWS